MSTETNFSKSSLHSASSPDFLNLDVENLRDSLSCGLEFESNKDNHLDDPLSEAVLEAKDGNNR
jgi:hypothetical protein